METVRRHARVGRGRRDDVVVAAEPAVRVRSEIGGVAVLHGREVAELVDHVLTRSEHEGEIAGATGPALGQPGQAGGKTERGAGRRPRPGAGPAGRGGGEDGGGGRPAAGRGGAQGGERRGGGGRRSTTDRPPERRCGGSRGPPADG